MISVIIPFFNAEHTIEKALVSVAKQTWKGHFEIIVINDGSKDGTRLIVENYIYNNPQLNISLINQENGGVAKARNSGLSIAKGDFIALLDADDVWYSQKTDQQLAILGDDQFKIDFLSCRRKYHEILKPYFIDKNNLAQVSFRQLMLRNEIQPSTVIFKRKVLENSGCFDDQQRYAEDLNFWLKVSLKNKMAILNEELVLAGGGKRTFGVSGLSANLREMERGFQKNLKEVLHQKRINFAEYLGYFIFYQLKYTVRLVRNSYYNILKK